MTAYRYTECGLDNVVIHGAKMIVDDDGEEVVYIPNITGLHKLITEIILTRGSSMTGQELRFLRTEMGMTQAELAQLVHREPLSISRWERGECPIDSNAEALIRLHTAQRLKIRKVLSVENTSKSCVPTAAAQPIRIDGSNPKHYMRAA